MSEFDELMLEGLRPWEQRLWRAYLIGRDYEWSGREIDLRNLVAAVQDDAAFDRAMESVEERAVRQLRAERDALRRELAVRDGAASV